jgi:ABC-type multidrug transport system ATPase subunit
VSGALHPGEMVALLGQPGSSCSSLLEALCGRLSGARVTGHVGMADKAYALSRHNSELNASVALIGDCDLHLPTLLLREVVFFALRSRRVARRLLSLKEARHRVYGLMDALVIGCVALSLVGSASIRRISGGEKRRLTIGAELVSGHAVVLVIEPSNGLELTLSLRVLKVLRLLARDSGAAVMVLILQPTVDFLLLFHRVLLLSRGSVAYDGPVAGAAPYFAALGYPCPPDKNEPEYLEGLSNSAARFAKAEAQRRRDHQAFLAEFWRKSPQSGAVEQRVAEARAAEVADLDATLKFSGPLHLLREFAHNA